MPPAVQSELARDQFLQALSPTELHMQTQLAHPQTLQEALEMAIERDLVWAGAINGHPARQPMVRSARERSEDSQKPAWVESLNSSVLSLCRRTAAPRLVESRGSAGAAGSLATLSESALQL